MEKCRIAPSKKLCKNLIGNYKFYNIVHIKLIKKPQIYKRMNKFLVYEFPFGLLNTKKTISNKFSIATRKQQL